MYLTLFQLLWVWSLLTNHFAVEILYACTQWKVSFSKIWFDLFIKWSINKICCRINIKKTCQFAKSIFHQNQWLGMQFLSESKSCFMEVRQKQACRSSCLSKLLQHSLQTDTNSKTADVFLWSGINPLVFMGIEKSIHSLNIGAGRIVSTWLVFSAQESQKLDTSDLWADFTALEILRPKSLKELLISFLLEITGSFTWPLNPLVQYCGSSSFRLH